MYHYLFNQCLSSNPVHGEVYSIQRYAINFVSDLREVSGFSLGTPVSSTIKTDRHDITEILFKVVLNTINQNLIFVSIFYYKHLRDRIISLRGEVWSHEPISILPRRLGGDVYVWKFFLSVSTIIYWIVELIWWCGIFVFHF